jgi:ribosome-associated toxin RatA of RatAB toxin-antitoxin module
MFDLVDDIESYPRFLPWCRSATVLSRNEDEVRATLELAKGSVHKKFSTLNRLHIGKMIEMRLLEGPFHHLEGFWRFEELREDACKISLDLDFEFKNRMVGMVVGPIFNPVANTLVDAFCKRAKEVYCEK